jgi:hypothetical protein
MAPDRGLPCWEHPRFHLNKAKLTSCCAILLAKDYTKEIIMKDAMKAFCGAWIIDFGYDIQKDL